MGRGTASAAARAAAGLEARGVGSGKSQPYLSRFSRSRRRWVAKSMRNWSGLGLGLGLGLGFGFGLGLGIGLGLGLP